MVNEAITNDMIMKKLQEAEIDYIPQGSKIKEIQEALKTASKRGTNSVGFPEFIAKSKDFILVIEDKADTHKQSKYCEKNNNKLDMNTNSIINYAENGALHYAQHIIKNTNFKKIFAFGCSGDEKHHIIKPIFVDENQYIILNEIENFKNFNEKNIDKFYRETILEEKSTEIIEIEEVLKKSTELNELLTSRGSLTDAEKPLVVSAILLALNENKDINHLLKADEINNDGKIINDAVCCNLQRIKVEQKIEAIMHQFNFIKDRPNLNEIDETLGKTPLKYFTEYIKEKIFPAISKNHEDILGFFYGEFIKYSGGDGQSLGIVLTPAHITELFCDLLEITPKDVVFDPCAGTGSFLISAMNRMLASVETEKEKKYIKQNNLHGIELKENMFSIATTNMVLRGDGKTNLICADFLKQDAAELKKNNYTVGMMNPPYSLRTNKETAYLSEIHFVKHLLDSLNDNARGAVIVPQSTMVGKNKEDKDIKKEILKHHTLEGVISLNGDTTFYRVGTIPCIAIFTAHVPHPPEKRCKFINFEDDGYLLSKHIGIVKTERTIERKEYLLKCWRDQLDAPSRFMVKSTIKDTDEWLHPFYYFDDEIPSEKEFQKTLNEYLSFEFDMVIQDKEYLFKKRRFENDEKNKLPPYKKLKWKEFKLSDIFNISSTVNGINKNKIKNISSNGNTPYVTRTDKNNGYDLFIQNQNEFNTNNGNVISIGLDTQTVFYQPYSFYTGQNIQILSNNNLNKYNALFIISLLKNVLEKFNWGGNGATLFRLKNSYIMLPINDDGKPNYKYMEQYMKNKEYELINKYFNFLKRNKD